ncbi:MAG: cell wall hydrolase [Eubacteriales bacterium]|nr:cell wall hydrolase [Eubacteriales bacterium]
MKSAKKILILLAAIGVMCGIVAGFLPVFRDAFAVENPRAVSLPTETVYYAPLEPEETTEVPTEPSTEPPETAPPETEPETVPEEADRTYYDTVPNYYETDYPDIRFGTGSFADYGSGVTSVAMVATYLTGYEYRPDELALWFSSYIGNQIQTLEYISDELQLPWERAENFHIARQALYDGKVVIALMGANSVFTTGQHFIVLTGINEDGKIMVNDPNRNNYDLWNLQKSFSEGFREGDILCGYSAAWIYDPAQMPEEPFRYEDPAPAEGPRYPDLTLRDEDTDLLAKLIWAEAQSEPFEGQQAIAEVVLNRVAADNFPGNVHDVLYAQDQFKAISQIYAAKPTHVQYEAIRRAQYGPHVVPEDVVFFGTYATNNNVWGTIGNHTFCHQY